MLLTLVRMMLNYQNSKAFKNLKLQIAHPFPKNKMCCKLQPPKWKMTRASFRHMHQIYIIEWNIHPKWKPGLDLNPMTVFGCLTSSPKAVEEKTDCK